MRLPIRPWLLLAALLLTRPAAAAPPPPPDEAPVTAIVETSLETANRQIRQFAFDGDPATSFVSKQAPTGSDHFTIVLDRPVTIRSIAVASGTPGGRDRLESGALAVSADGQAFEDVAKFADGSAKFESPGRPIRAIRIKPTADETHPMTIREVVIESAEPVATFKYPIEIAVDVTDSPEMKEWADKVARLCERWYPRICEALQSDGYKPTNYITMVITSKYNGVAEAGGGRITGSTRFFKQNPDDLGAMIHETVHIVQRYRGRNPSWLVEGVADYYRFWIYEPGKAGPVRANRAHYNDSYRTTATFLAYLTDKYDKEIVFKLNKMMREGKYKEEAFKDMTGKTVQELGDEWLASLKK